MKRDDKGALRAALDEMAKLEEVRSWEEALGPTRLGGSSRWGSSRYDALKRCPYLYELRYRRGYGPRTPDRALEVGGLTHEVIALVLEEQRARGPDSTAGVTAAHELLAVAETLTPQVTSEVRGLFRAWLTMFGPGSRYSYASRLHEVEPLIEVGPKGPNRWPFPYSARLDTVLRCQDGFEIIEHKTSKTYDANLLMSYKMEPQFMGHFWLWHQVGEKRFGGPLRRYTVELLVKGAEPRIEHIQIFTTKALLNSWEQETHAAYAELDRLSRGVQRWPHRRGYHCRFCYAFDHCASGGIRLNSLRKIF